jgi:hypothetical protein
MADVQDAVVAAADLVNRAGARQFEIGYLNDEDDPAFATAGPQWWAHAQYSGTRIIVEGFDRPDQAAEALAQKLLTGAKCRCGKLVALSDGGALFTSGQMADGSTWTPEQARAAGQCRWRRAGSRLGAVMRCTLGASERSTLVSGVERSACPDCAVSPGQPHEDGCDVARCTVCGAQRIGCDHAGSEQGWGHIWTGEWPGDAEVREGLAADLNDLTLKGATDRLRWDGQRWRAGEGEG